MGERDILIAMRAYLDSSGKPERKHGYLTLAAVAANDDKWKQFEIDWKSILIHHDPPAEYIHMREVLRLIDGFDPSLGWDIKSAIDAVYQCISYMSHMDKKSIRIFYCSVDLEAWRKLRTETYQMPDPVDICNTFCSEQVVGWHLISAPVILDTETDKLSYFFDRSEPFEPRFRERWNLERDLSKKLGTTTIWDMITDIGPVAMEDTPGVQAADIIAWARNRETFKKPGDIGHELAQQILQVIPSYSIVWDEEKLRQQYRPLIYGP